jgi:hypothetical protein
LWNIWISRNHIAFNQSRWHVDHVWHLIWSGLQDYGKIPKTKTLKQIKQVPASTVKSLGSSIQPGTDSRSCALGKIGSSLGFGTTR